MYCIFDCNVCRFAGVYRVRDGGLCGEADPAAQDPIPNDAKVGGESEKDGDGGLRLCGDGTRSQTDGKHL